MYGSLQKSVWSHILQKLWQKWKEDDNEAADDIETGTW